MADAEAISKEISSKLRGYEGLTAVKLTDCPSILEALGTTDAAEAYKRFVQAVESLPDDKYTEALKSALRLDPSLPTSLTGRSGRRALFGVANSVSEETVKTWEARAIDVLTQAVASPPPEVEWVSEMIVIFTIANDKIAHMSETRFYNVNNRSMRMETRESYNPRGVSFPFAVYQVLPGEPTDALEVYALFPDDQLPKKTFTVSGVDLFGLLTCNYHLIDSKIPPKSAIELLGDERSSAEAVDAFADMSGYVVRWVDPRPFKIFGLAWQSA